MSLVVTKAQKDDLEKICRDHVKERRIKNDTNPLQASWKPLVQWIKQQNDSEKKIPLTDLRKEAILDYAEKTLKAQHALGNVAYQQRDDQRKYWWEKAVGKFEKMERDSDRFNETFFALAEFGPKFILHERDPDFEFACLKRSKNFETDLKELCAQLAMNKLEVLKAEVDASDHVGGSTVLVKQEANAANKASPSDAQNKAGAKPKPAKK